MRIKAIRFEPGTVAVDLTRLDVVRRSEAVRLGEDVIGVWVNNERIPWHRVQSAEYEAEPPEAQLNYGMDFGFPTAVPVLLPPRVHDEYAAIMEHKASAAQKSATQQPAKPTKRK